MAPLPTVAGMSRRSGEPSAKVEQILEESREPRVLELPSTVATGRYAVSRQAVLGVALVVLVAVLMLGGRFWMARQGAAPEPVATVAEDGDRTPFAADGDEPKGGDGAGSEASTAAGAAASPSDSGRVTVHVVGQVKRPGIVTLAAGSRVADAVERSGGTTSGADLAGVNIARPLVDGEQVVVPKPGETPPPPPAGAAPEGAPAGPADPDAPADGSAPVNLNTADLTTLETLPGVGPVLAQRILDWRTEHGEFTAVEELGEVSGIGEKIYAQLEPEVTV